jgi:uncharacterized sulfatase
MSRLYVVIVCALILAPAGAFAQEKKPRPKLPNILWITSEDHGPHLGCYGDKFARTPNIDKLAKKGMIFRRARPSSAASIRHPPAPSTCAR